MSDKPIYRFAVMLVMETDDPRLAPEAINQAMTSADSVTALRGALIEHLPGAVRRVAAVFPVEHAEALVLLHEAVGDEIAQSLRAKGIDVDVSFNRPPADYVPPTTE
jgi:hypothetical protein